MNEHAIKRRHICKFCQKTFSDEIDLKHHIETHSFECYVCQQDFSSLKYLISHIRKHVVFEQWVDPLSVYLSNWSPEKSREILQNQPLVLVENLNINSINLRSLGDFGSAERNSLNNFESGIDHSNNAATDLLLCTEEVFLPSIDESEQVTNCQKDEKPKIVKLEPFPIHPDNELQNPYDDNCIVYVLPSDSEGSPQLPILMQQSDTNKNNDVLPKLEIFEPLPNDNEGNNDPNTSDDCTIYEVPSDSEVHPIVKSDTTANVAHLFGEDPIELSSDDEPMDELELFHCYFCNKTFRSLNSLGIHSKKCSLAP